MTLIAYNSGWITFVQPIAIPQILTAPLSTGLEFLTTLDVNYPPEKLPGLKQFGQLTPISRSERRGLNRHAAVGKLYQCIAPYYPLQIAPEAGLRIEVAGLSFSKTDFRIYLHSFGFILCLRTFFEVAKDTPGLDGFSLARRLYNIESNRGLKIGTKSLRRPKSVSDLFGDVYERMAASIFRVPIPLSSLNPPFCVCSPEVGEFPKSCDDLPDGHEDRLALFSAIQRFTGRPQDLTQPLGNKCFATNLGEAEGEKGWALGAEKGIALLIRPGDTKTYATNARLCYHKNVARFIGSYQLYQQYLTKHAESALRPEKDALQHAVNARDTIVVRYSPIWLRWAIQRLGHEAPVGYVVKSQGLQRPYNPNARVEQIQILTTFDVVPVFNFKSFPSALCVAKPDKVGPLVTFRLRNNTPNPVKVKLTCELEQYSLVDRQEVDVKPDDSATYESRVTLKARDAKDLTVGENTQVSVTWQVLEPAEEPENPRTEMITVLQKSYFPCARQPLAQKTWSNFSWLIAGWIDRDSGQLSKVYAEAAATNQRRLSGYHQVSGPGADEQVIPQVRAIYEALRVRNLSYGNQTKLEFLIEDGRHYGQTVRFPVDSLNGGVINCLDGCVLFASLLARCDLDPAVLFVPGHALVGWKRFQSRVPEWVFLDAIKLVDSSFEDALDAGRQIFSSVADLQMIEVSNSNPPDIENIDTAIILVDIRSVWASGVQPIR